MKKLQDNELEGCVGGGRPEFDRGLADEFESPNTRVIVPGGGPFTAIEILAGPKKA